MNKFNYREILNYILIFLISFCIVYSVFGMAFIPSASMEPTLSVGHKYPYSKLSYLVSSPKYGDIVIYDQNGVVYCKRIIGVPGDHIEFSDGKICINGKVMEETFANGNTYPILLEKYDVPPGEYFVLGDNRENSRDSRFWAYPYIRKGQILGKVIRFKK